MEQSTPTCILLLSRLSFARTNGTRCRQYLISWNNLTCVAGENQGSRSHLNVNVAHSTLLTQICDLSQKKKTFPERFEINRNFGKNRNTKSAERKAHENWNFIDSLSLCCDLTYFFSVFSFSVAPFHPPVTLLNNSWISFLHTIKINNKSSYILEKKYSWDDVSCIQ